MTDEDPSASRLIRTLWGRLMRDGQFHAAAMTGLLGHFLSRETGDEDLENGASDLVAKAMSEVEETARGPGEKPEPACSFCGKTQPEVGLVAGPSVFICHECARARCRRFSRPCPKRALENPSRESVHERHATETSPGNTVMTAPFIHRTLTLAGDQGALPLEVRIFQPVENDDVSWSCAYEIRWPSNIRQSRAFGVDSVQALWLAFHKIGADLYTSDPYKAGRLTYEGGPNLGFPHPSSSPYFDLPPTEADMDHQTARSIVNALMQAGASLNEVARVLETIPDEAEKRTFKRTLGEAMGLVGVDMIRPIIRQYPDLDPD